ncbi:MAG: DUF58 domain-containing protein [Pyrodictiaceae archaeon]
MFEGPGSYLTEYEAPITGYGRALILLGALLAVAGFFSPSEIQAYLLSIGMAIIIVVIMLRQYFALKASILDSLEVKHELEQPLIEGKEAKVRLRIVNKSPILIERLDVIDNPPRLFKIPAGVAPRAVVFLPVGGEAVIEYRVRLVMGEHEWGETRLILEDPLGLFRAERIVKTGLRVRVQPRPLGLPRRIMISIATALPTGVSKTGRKGSGTEFHSVREYMPGDDIRLVDWKAYARLRKLMVKEFEQEVSLYAIIVLDVTPTMIYGVVGETKLEYSMRLAASLATYFASRGDYYTLLVAGTQGEASATPWLRGRKTSIIALRRLAAVKWPSLDEASRVSYEDRVKSISKTLTSILPREKTIVMLLTDFHEDPEAAKAYAERLSRLIRLRHEVIAVTPLTTLFEVRALGKGIDAAIYRLLAFERIKQYRDMFRILRSQGIKVLAAGPTDLLSMILSRLEAYRRMG